MELKEFVAETLVQIQQGVQEATHRVSELQLNGVINPIWAEPEKHDPNHVQDVAFDIAVTVSDSTAGKGGGGINVWSVKLGAEISESAERSHVSRIQFSIPLIPPATRVHPNP
jgi:hypothetical protein